MKKLRLRPRSTAGVFARVTSYLGTFSLAYKLIEKNAENLVRLRVVGDMVNRLVEAMELIPTPEFSRARRDEIMDVCDQAELLLEQLENDNGDNQSARA